FASCATGAASASRPLPCATLFRSRDRAPDRGSARDLGGVVVRSASGDVSDEGVGDGGEVVRRELEVEAAAAAAALRPPGHGGSLDRKSTRLNSSHVSISYAVFCLK